MSEIAKFVETIKTLRDPEKGCPWDLEQTHASLKRYMLEESYECLDAIDQITSAISDDAKQKAISELKEELGDLLLQILLHAQIADDHGYFNFEDVAKTCNDKMRSRHPHVFDINTAKAQNVDDVHKNWDAAKAKEKANRKSIFEGIPQSMPALARAWKISKKAVKESFEWDTEEQLWEQLESEISELKEAMHEYESFTKSIDAKSKEDPNIAQKPEIKTEKDLKKTSAELELGDILFTIVNIGRWFKIDPEDALRMTNDKFVNRFDAMIEIAKAGTDKKLSDYSSDELLKLWQEAKLKCSAN